MTEAHGDRSGSDRSGTDNGAAPARGSWSWRLKSAYMAGARGAGKVLTAARILPAEPPPREQRIRHWLVSLTRIYDSVAVAELGVPWWTYDASAAVEEWLAARARPIRVFEWGAGSSTIWLASRSDEVLSIEHHDEFFELIGPHLAPLENVTLRHVAAPSVASPRIASAKKGNEGLDFYDYVHAIDDTDGSFDLIVIDGRAREACLGVAIERLAPDGIIVFDDPHRRRYREAIDASGLRATFHRGLSPTIPYPVQTSILAKPAR